MTATKVVLGVSGGVDSAVSAYLLQQQGYDVTGVFMDQLGDQTALADAQAVCRQLGIPCVVVDYRAIFQSQVVDRFQRERQGDYTPNPCCWCNPQVKFRCLLTYADQHDIPYVATGHYARVVNGQLWRGVDPHKDQSYFLAGLSATQLARLILPLGNYTKAAVRQLAAQINLPVHNKPDSSDLCFPVAHHGWTIGQGIKQGGQSQKLYYLGHGQIGSGDDPALFRQDVVIRQPQWSVPVAWPWTGLAQVRSRHRAQPCTATAQADGSVVVHFATPVRAVTPGQWCVLYAGDQVLGGGEISA